MASQLAFELSQRPARLSAQLAPKPPALVSGQVVQKPSAAPVTLHRVDPGKRMARFYSLHVERDLFGGVVLRRQWGRIGTAGRTRLEPHKDEQAATMVLERIEQAKRRRGYELTAR